jgi:threonine dehydratase
MSLRRFEQPLVSFGRDPVNIPQLPDILQAAQRINSQIHRTPVLTCASLEEETGVRLFLKCENFQKTGSFKFRGATNAVLCLANDEAARGVSTHSSGNHGAALACAAAIRKIPAHIVVPENAAQPKQESILRYGGHITHCAPTLKARETTLAEVVQRTGAVIIPPYNDFNIISGQGTAALELLEEIENLDALIAPVGGGGLLSGTSICAKAIRPEIKIWGAVPEQADDAKQSIDAGKIIPANPNTIADGLQTSLGPLTFEIIRNHVEDILTVSESEIIQAMRTIWERTKILIEPSAAVPAAACFRHREIFSGQKVGIILTGGNLDLNRLPF